MSNSRLKYASLILMSGCIVGLFIFGIPVVLFFLGSWALLHHGLLRPKPVKINKVVFDRDTGVFTSFVENNTPSALKVKYAIRYVTPAGAPQTANKDGLMDGRSWSAHDNYLLLSENTSENTLEPGKTSIMESGDISYGMWNPTVRGKVQVTVSYTKPGAKEEETTLSVPLEQSSTHPYLRKTGSARSFILTNPDGSVAGTASSLAELLEQADRNRTTITAHVEKGDVQRWVLGVIKDEVLYDRMRVLARVDKKELAASASALIRRRIAELNKQRFMGAHPLLSDVEEWHAFKLKTGEKNTVRACRSLKELLGALLASKPDAVHFHTRRGNDFAAWIEDVLGDRTLAEKTRKVDYSNPEQAKTALCRLLSQRIRQLG